MRILLVLLLFIGLARAASAQLNQGPHAGTVSLGLRSSFSFFNSHERNDPGQGVGGQFRIRLGNRVSTDWFYDYLTARIGHFAHRQDQHIGWSVLFYLKDPGAGQPFVQPYVLAGHCFDYTRQIETGNPANAAERWSSAVQGGAGVHLNLTPFSDVSLVGQYMMHLGTDVHAHLHDGQVEFHKEKGGGMEGHLLVHVSYNLKLFRAW